jgi:hypothetical protein
MQYEHEFMEPAEDAPAARALLENDCGRSELFVLMVAGISHWYVRVDNIFNDKYEEIPGHGTPVRSNVMGLRVNYDAK